MTETGAVTFGIIIALGYTLHYGVATAQNNVTTPMCASKLMILDDNILYPGCNNSLKSSWIFILNNVDYFQIMNGLEDLEAVVERNPFVSAFCDELIRNYLCNYFYPPCNESDGIPIGICEEDCEKFGTPTENDQCMHELGFLLTFQVDELKYLRTCNNTLQHIEEEGIHIPQSSQCIKIFEVAEDLNMEVPTVADPHSFHSVSLPVVIATPLAVVVLISFSVTLTVVHALYRCRKSKRRKSLDSRLRLISMYNQYTFNGLTSQEQEEPLFQLTMEDIMENSILKDTLVPFDWIKVEEEIGHGAFGSVYRGEILPQLEMNDQLTKTRVAIKTIRNSSASYGELKGFLQESMLMCGFNHPHVLGLIGITLDANNSPYLLLPFMENGDLREFLKNKRGTTMSNITNYPKGLSCELLTKMCWEIAQGMEYLASKKLVHRDLAARNCMVDINLNIKVADFGLTRAIYQMDYYRQVHRSRVPIKWMSPESLHDRISNEKTDVWSYGITCWEVFSLGRTPYPTISNADLLTYLEHGHRLQKPYLCPDLLYALITSCWNGDPERRPTFFEICQSFTTEIVTSDAIFSHTLIANNESLLDSVMSAISEWETFSMKSKADEQEEYVDIHPQVNSFFNDIGVISNMSAISGMQDEGEHKYATLPSHDYINRTSSPLKTVNGIKVQRIENRVKNDSLCNDKDMIELGLELRVVQPKDCNSNESSQVEHVRQTSTISDYVTMESVQSIL